MTYKKAILSIVAVVGIHLIAMVFDLYFRYEWFDIPMHFSGGLVIGFFGIALWRQTVRVIEFSGPGWLRACIGPLFVLGFVAMVGIAWEWHEYLLDQFRDRPLPHQPSVGDTMADFFFDELGGFVALLIAWRGYEKR